MAALSVKRGKELAPFLLQVWDMATFSLVKELSGTNWFRSLAVNDTLLFSGSKEAVMVSEVSVFDYLGHIESPFF